MTSLFFARSVEQYVSKQFYSYNAQIQMQSCRNPALPVPVPRSLRRAAPAAPAAPLPLPGEGQLAFALRCLLAGRLAPVLIPPY